MKEINEILKNIRTDYNLDVLDEISVAKDPIMQFALWMKMAVESGCDDPNAMNLATVSATGRPSSRIVLLRNFDDGGFVFFTNYHSQKGRDVEANPHAALNFFWPTLHKQIRIEGIIEKISESDSDEYFNTRPKESQLGSIASNQSNVLKDRVELEKKIENLTKEFSDKPITRPPHWGGYRVVPDKFEFWQGRPSRIHDRIQYELSGNKTWNISRLSP